MYSYNEQSNLLTNCILYIIFAPFIKLFGVFFNSNETRNNTNNDLEQPEQYIHSSFPSTPSFILTQNEFKNTMIMGPNYVQHITPNENTCFGCKYHINGRRFHMDYGGCMYDGIEF